jgi:Asp-tRNA(Asn)/Glu-tRNA(Gln) amidotransferase A subunit family amidase
MMKPGAAPYAKEMRFSRLRTAYSSGERTPVGVVHEVCERIEARGEDGVWIHVEPESNLLARAQELEARRADADELPLYGVPFAVKDNIDVAGGFGVRYVAQPGGSAFDDAVEAACREHGIAMVKTGVRLFHH